jgi:hypothetical protein
MAPVAFYLEDTNVSSGEAKPRTQVCWEMFASSQLSNAHFFSYERSNLFTL